MAKVYSRGRSKVWYIRYTDKYNQTHRKKTEYKVSDYTRKAVQDIFDEVGHKKMLRTLGLTGGDIRLTEVFEEFDKNYLQKKYVNNNRLKNLIYANVKKLVDHIEEAHPQILINNVDTGMVENWVFERTKTQAVSTIKKDKGRTSWLFDYAERKDYIKPNSNPVRNSDKTIVKPNNKANQKYVNNAIPDEFLFPVLKDQTIPSEYRLLWTILRFTGIDPSDALNLKEHNINRVKLELTIDRNKNNSRTAPIPIHPLLQKEDLLNLKGRFFSKDKRYKGKLICKEIIIKNSLSYLRSKLIARQYTLRVAHKCLRYSFAQGLVNQGLDDTQRQHMMGHTNVDMQLVYTAGSMSLIKEAVGRQAKELDLNFA